MNINAILRPTLVMACLLGWSAGCDRTEPEPEPEPAPATTAATLAPPATPSTAAPVAAPATGEVLETYAGDVPIRIAPELVEFGAVEPDSVNRAEFTITNAGDRPVRVERVTPSCVCTTLTDLAGTVIAPGGSVSLEASLDAPSVPGRKEAKVFVVLSGMKSPAIVRLAGTVTLPIQPTPAYADALKGVESGIIGLSATNGRPFRVLASNGAPPVFADGRNPESSRDAYALRWSIAGLAPVPRWWIFTTDREDCPLVACRVRHETTGSRWDADRLERRWIPEDDFFTLGRLAVGESVDVAFRIKHYNPPARGAIDKPAWARVLRAGSTDPALEASLVSATADGPDAVAVVVRIVPRGPATDLLYAPVELETATGTGRIEIAAVVVADGA